MNVQYLSKWRYPDGTLKINLPSGQVPGYPIPTKFTDLTEDQRIALEYNQALEIKKDNEYDYTNCLTWEWQGNIYTQILTQDPVFREAELFPIYYANKQIEIKTKADAALAPFAARFSMREEVSWAQQAYEAREWTVDNTFSTPMIDGIISVTGEAKADFCAIVLANETGWSAIAGPVFGQRQVYTDQLNAATTCAEIKAIEVTYVVPELAVE